MSRKPSCRGIAPVLAVLILAAFAATSFATEPPPVWKRSWGTCGYGPGQFGSSAMSIAADRMGHIYVGDGEIPRVEKFTTSGQYITEWTDPPEPEWHGISSIASDAGSYVYVIGTGHVRKFTSSGSYVTGWGTWGSDPGQFDYGCGIGTGISGPVYVADRYNSRVQKFSSLGTLSRIWGDYGSAEGQFEEPSAVAVGSDGCVWIADEDNFRIQKFTSSGAFLCAWGTEGSGPGQFGYGLTLAVDMSDNVYVGDGGNYRIQKFTPDGQFLTQWGNPGDGPGEFGSRLGVAVDQNNHVFVADSDHSRVQEFCAAYMDLSVDVTASEMDGGPINVPIGGASGGNTPYSIAINTDSTATLIAPATLNGWYEPTPGWFEPAVWCFGHWQINGVAKADAQRTITFRVSESTTAIAVYKLPDQVRITGRTSVKQRSRQSYRCTVYFTDGTTRNTTLNSRWREGSTCLRFVKPGNLKVGSVRRSTRCKFTASYGGVRSRFTVLVRK